MLPVVVVFSFCLLVVKQPPSCCGNVGIRAFGRISKRGGKSGKLAFLFSTLSTARHFHSLERAFFSSAAGDFGAQTARTRCLFVD
jgi:hypothetical protein